MRIISLIPSATEIIAALGLREDLAGISHECDFPPYVESLPRVTYCPIYNAGLSSLEIDQAVRDSLARGESLYHIHSNIVMDIRPDIIVTQGLCDVCAIGYRSVEDSLNGAIHQSPHPGDILPDPPVLVNLEASSLKEIYGTIRQVADAAGVPERGEKLIEELQTRENIVRDAVAKTVDRPRVLFLEWLDPAFGPGHWTPELIEIAGGVPVAGAAGVPSRTLDWARAIERQPEVIFIACCGYDIEKTEKDLATLRAVPGWDDIPAVRNGRVYMSDGNQYFNRPGPRIIDSLEMLAKALHPELVGVISGPTALPVDSVACLSA